MTPTISLPTPPTLVFQHTPTPAPRPTPIPEKMAVPNTAAAPAAKAAPDFPFSLYQGEAELGGKELSISDLRGKPVVLNFWAGLCPPCRAEMPDLQEFHDEFNDRVLVLGIDVWQFTGLGNEDDALALLENLGVTYPTAVTDDGTIMRKYSVLGMPTTVFLNSRGEIFRKWTGVLNLETLAGINNEMLSSKSFKQYSLAES